MKIKILFAVNVDHFFISHRLPIALKLLEEGYEVHIVTSVTKYQKYLHNLGLKVHPLNMFGNQIGILSMFKTYKNLLKLFKEIKPTLVHLVTIKPIILGGVAAKKAKVPI